MTQKRVPSLVASLSLDEKLRLLHGATNPDGSSVGYVPPVPRVGVPALRMVDGPMGIRAIGGSATAFPASVALAASWNPRLAREQGASMAREARAHGQNVLLGPGMNIIRVPHCGRNFEYYSEDPYLSARFAAASVDGIQSEDVIATAKHYVANNQETNRYRVSAAVTERALREIYLPAFRAAVEEADVGAVMTAYNRVNGTHMSDHRTLLRDMLKDEFGFDGFVMSDWWGTESSVGAARAGLDVEMPGIPFEERVLAERLPEEVDPSTIDFPDTLPDMHEGGLFGEPLREAVEAGAVDEAVIDEKVRRILETMARFELLDTDPDEERRGGELDTPEHRQLARRIAIEGTVLLKNEGVLPLDETAAIAIVGPNADATKLGGGGSSEVTPFRRTTPVDGLRERATECRFERGVPPITESSLFDAFGTEDRVDESPADTVDTADADDVSLDAAVEAADGADCVVVVVQDDTTESEDRDDLRLPGQQDELVRAVADAAERSVVVLRTGGPVELPWIDDVDAVLETWYAGQAEGEALAAVLYGDADPGGRLPFTFGRRADDYPTTAPERFPGTNDGVDYAEGVFVGYRYFDREDAAPLFPFGHGHSYASFEYGESAVERDGDEVTVTVPVRNVGTRPGKEVVQVYVHDEDPPVPRPPRELKGFETVRLDPEERRRVSVTLDRDAFAYYDEDEGWVVSERRFTLLVGRSAREIRDRVSVTIE
ncbi:beta-glucosidase [Haladaptatus halobius]|uniref:beta-glucosidase n=1 Tax=Haladaptatus halobius TaxID=2884875 RepID=UPI001D0A9FAA|nr:glycoside hydrolase family 3 C-terminal domain-containing protein [Haladaptatus halobius]